MTISTHAADPFRRHELPAHERYSTIAELDDEVGRGEQEGEARDQRRALLEQRAADRGGGVGATGARRAERRCQRDLPEAGAPERGRIRSLRDDRLQHRRNQEAEHQAPAGLPEHARRHQQRLAYR